MRRWDAHSHSGVCSFPALRPSGFACCSPLPLCSAPYMQREVEDLARSKEFNNLCPYYLDLQDEVLRMQVGAGGAALSVPAPRCLFFWRSRRPSCCDGWPV